jgi:hypothetical protein
MSDWRELQVTTGPDVGQGEKGTSEGAHRKGKTKHTDFFLLLVALIGCLVLAPAHDISVSRKTKRRNGQKGNFLG